MIVVNWFRSCYTTTLSMDYTTSERRVDDKARECQVIHLRESVINHDRSAHGSNMIITTDIMPLWMKKCDKL